MKVVRRTHNFFIIAEFEVILYHVVFVPFKRK